MAKKAVYFLGALILGLVALFFLDKSIEWAGWLGGRVFPWIRRASDIAFLALVFIFLPLSIIRPARPLASAAILVISYVFGTLPWLQSFLTTYFFWGVAGAATGVFFAGVGVVPLAFVAASLHHEWSLVRELITIATITILSRLFSRWLGKRSAKPIDSVEMQKVQYESGLR
jgi:hypothetical protein